MALADFTHHFRAVINRQGSSENLSMEIVARISVDYSVNILFTSLCSGFKVT